MAEPIRDMRDAMAALHRDTEKIQGLRNQIARLTSPMPCGHPGACMVQVEEGTAHCSACEREGALRERLEAAEGVVTDMVNQECTHEDGLFSFAISSNADALRFLASVGAVEITEEHGRMVYAVWKDAQEKEAESDGDT